MARSYFLIMALLSAIFLQASSFSAHAQKSGVMETAREYDLKAVYLYNFLRFTNWPQGMPKNEDASFTIGVIGDSPILPPLQVIAKKSRGKIRTATIPATASQDVFKQYDLLFISRTEQRQLHSLLASLSSLQVLTVSDIDTFCDAGGMIRLVNVDNRIRWEINLSQLKRSGMSVKAQLLNSAWKVR